MESVESKGKSVDEAIFNGLNELGLGIDEVHIDIVHEGSKGLFGIGKSAVVRLTKKDEQEILTEQKQNAAEETSVDSRRKPRQRRERPDRERRDHRSERPERERRQDYEPVEQAVSVGESEAQLFLDELFQKMNIDAKSVTTAKEEELVKIVIEGKDTAVLIGRRGDTLDALQYLTGLVINRGKEGYQKVMLDAENYRHKREITLEKLAKRLANNVTKYGKPVSLEPMNPYERRILHSTLQSNPRVETYSEGEEPYRHVVIRKKRGNKSESQAE